MAYFRTALGRSDMSHQTYGTIFFIMLTFFGADRRRYSQAPWFHFRETLALVRAWLDLNLLKPLPVLGDPISVDWSSRVPE